jgi:hypothetical protein
MTRQRALPRRLTRATGRGDACGEPCLEFDDASRDPGAFELDVGQSRRGYVTEGSSPKNPFRRAPNGKY